MDRTLLWFSWLYGNSPLSANCYRIRYWLQSINQSIKFLKPGRTTLSVELKPLKRCQHFFGGRGGAKSTSGTSQVMFGTLVNKSQNSVWWFSIDLGMRFHRIMKITIILGQKMSKQKKQGFLLCLNCILMCFWSNELTGILYSPRNLLPSCLPRSGVLHK